MVKFNKGANFLNHSSTSFVILMILLVSLLQLNQRVHAATTTCSSSSNCTLREWLTKLREESYSLECTLSQLEKSTTLLSRVNYSSTPKRLSQIEKLRKTIAILKGEIEIINLTCSTFYGPDCNLTAPECDLKCLSCPSAGQCSACSGNWDGPTCSQCKSGWNGTDCNTPLCDSKCISCAAPGVCTTCAANWNGATCSTCKSGWNGTLCNSPICDSKCSNCTSPGICSNCTGNWNGPTCSQCKSGWNGTDCNTPTCGANCTSCSGSICSSCKTGWYGSDCNSNFPLILNSAQITKFTSSIMNTQITSSKLLFKATRDGDGFTASSFHTKCNNKGPTIVIIKATSGAIFGGYTSVSWQSGSGSWAVDNSAFLFSLISSTREERFVKLTFQNSQDYKNANLSNQYGIYNGINYGPTFGGGYDIYIADNSNVNTNSATNLCWSYCETTMSLNSDTSKKYLAGSYTFQVEDYEVYSL